MLPPRERLHCGAIWYVWDARNEKTRIRSVKFPGASAVFCLRAEVQIEMASPSPSLEGFRAAFRRPSLTFAEIAWRWAVGATATGFLLFGLVEYLSTLPVTNGELLFLHTGQPYFVAQALARIFHGSMPRVVFAAVLAGFFLTALWVVAASLGRLATVRGLLEYFGRDAASGVTASDLRALLRLNFLRAAVVLASTLAFAGAAILAGFVSSAQRPRPVRVVLLFLVLSGIVACAAWTLNWLLSLAGIFAVRDGEDETGAISAAVQFCREHGRAVSAVTSWTGLVHLIVFFLASVAVGIPLAFVAVAPWRVIAAATLLLTLIYLAIADWLYMARLAGYIAILEMPEATVATASELPAGGSLPQTTIDRDEPILSDTSILAVET